MMSQPPAPVNLPSMQAILKEIAMLGSTHAVISDIRHGFFQWPINQYLQRFFGIACGATFAIMKVLPMGWCHSPRLQQCGAWGLIIRCKKGQSRLGLTEPDGKTPKRWGHDPPQFVRLYDIRGKVVGLVRLGRVTLGCTFRKTDVRLGDAFRRCV